LDSVASFITHAAVTCWSAFQNVHTRHFQNTYDNIVVDALCGGMSLIPDYWRSRAKTEIPSLVFNVLALLMSGILSWKVTKTFTWEGFKKTGADRKASRAYKVCSSFTRLIAFRDEGADPFYLAGRLSWLYRSYFNFPCSSLSFRSRCGSNNSVNVVSRR
jgi:hypothetical protein